MSVESRVEQLEALLQRVQRNAAAPRAVALQSRVQRAGVAAAVVPDRDSALGARPVAAPIEPQTAHVAAAAPSAGQPSAEREPSAGQLSAGQLSAEREPSLVATAAPALLELDAPIVDEAVDGDEPVLALTRKIGSSAPPAEVSAPEIITGEELTFEDEELLEPVDETTAVVDLSREQAASAQALSEEVMIEDVDEPVSLEPVSLDEPLSEPPDELIEELEAPAPSVDAVSLAPSTPGPSMSGPSMSGPSMSGPSTPGPSLPTSVPPSAGRVAASMDEALADAAYDLRAPSLTPAASALVGTEASLSEMPRAPSTGAPPLAQGVTQGVPTIEQLGETVHLDEGPAAQLELDEPLGGNAVLPADDLGGDVDEAVLPTGAGTFSETLEAPPEAREELARVALGEIRAQVAERPVLSTNVAEFIGAHERPQPASFVAQLDASLALGA